MAEYIPSAEEQYEFELALEVIETIETETEAKMIPGDLSASQVVDISRGVRALDVPPASQLRIIQKIGTITECLILERGLRDIRRSHLTRPIGCIARRSAQ